MSMDRITEIIAHFIGDFALSDEIGRIRADYEDIPVLPEPDPEREALDFEGLRLTPTHEIEDLDPQIVYQPLPPSPFAIPVAPPQPLPGPEHVIEVVSAATLRIEMAPVKQMARPEPMSGLEIPPPSSVAAMLWMSNRLEDADVFGLADAAGMALAADLADMLQVLSEQLASLSPLPSPFEALSGSSIGALDWAELTAEITEAAAQLATSPLGGVVLQGGETLGVHVDGVVAETLPDWHDLLPAFLREKEDEEAADTIPEDETGSDDDAVEGDSADGDAGEGDGANDDASGTEAAGHGLVAQGNAGDQATTIKTVVSGEAADFDKAMNGLQDEASPASDTQETPLVVTGGNQLINEVSITSNWLDAPLIVVEGDAREITAISQVNATFDRDTVTGPAQATHAPHAPSMVQNAVSVTSASNPVPRDPDHAGQQPSNWAIARITGDLVQVNGVQQYNFASDTDSLRIDLPSSSLRLGAGENQLENLAVLNQFGWTFDLIVVGGNMIDANLIRQGNLLLDDDIVTTAPSAGATLAAARPVGKDAATAGTAQLPASDVSAQATTAATETQAVSSGAAPATSVASAPQPISAPVTATTSSQISAPEATQTTTQVSAPASVQKSVVASTPEAASTATPVSAPATTPAAAPKTAVTEPAPKADAVPASAASPTAAPDNLSYNEARIHTQGQDMAAAVPKALAQASKALAEGAEALGREVLGLDVFEGIDLLKVLIIEGDFTTLNWIDQINVLGDSDRVELLKEAIAALPDAQVVTGSNLLANLASIEELGVDSKIMAKGEAFSDALLHQAGFVEDGAPATGVGLTQLASEAVAFLADGMIETAAADIEAAQSTIDGGLAAMSTSQADLMQTMLS
jgi:hypothetical protein